VLIAGRILEELFFSAKDEVHFRKISRSITQAIVAIRNRIVEKTEKNAIVFEAGDDLLFRSSFSKQELEAMQGLYNSETSGLTCSIGYGSSFQEVYLALKLAKTRPGKNSIAGVAWNLVSKLRALIALKAIRLIEPFPQERIKLGESISLIPNSNSLLKTGLLSSSFQPNLSLISARCLARFSPTSY
jgi:hypothetical protein